MLLLQRSFTGTYAQSNLIWAFKNYVFADFIQPETFPENVKRQLQQLKDKEEAEKRQKELDKSTCKVCNVKAKLNV